MRVLVVGAGIAGPTLAYWLDRLGHRPALVESAPELRRGGYLVDFWGAGFDVAERMGIVRALRRNGFHLTEARAVGRGGRRFASFEPSAFVGSVDRYVTIAAFDVAGYRPRDELAAVMHADLGFQLLRMSLHDDGKRRPRPRHGPKPARRRRAARRAGRPNGPAERLVPRVRPGPPARPRPAPRRRNR
jgi:2-polyprenyl-6-methoxyphenol hydroxylase-like FAD-dependent oxidoreductase